MINHVRTVILNRPHGPDTGEYVPIAYRAFDLPESLERVELAVFKGVNTVAQRVARVDRVMRVLHHPELLPYILLPDSRLTYRFDAFETEFEARGELDIAQLETRLNRSVDRSESYTAIFGGKTYPDAFADLRTLWNQSHEPCIRCGAAISAYALACSEFGGY